MGHFKLQVYSQPVAPPYLHIMKTNPGDPRKGYLTTSIEGAERLELV